MVQDGEKRISLGADSETMGRLYRLRAGMEKSSYGETVRECLRLCDSLLERNMLLDEFYYMDHGDDAGDGEELVVKGIEWCEAWKEMPSGGTEKGNWEATNQVLPLRGRGRRERDEKAKAKRKEAKDAKEADKEVKEVVRHGNRSLTDDHVRAIRREYFDGKGDGKVTYHQLAKKYGVSHSVIGDVIKNRSYTDVE